MGALLEWWNLVFVLPFLLAVGFYLLLASGAIAADHDHEYPEAPMLEALTFLGIGRTPLSIVLTTLWLTWGFVGYAANMLLSGVLPFPLFVPISLLVAGGSALLLTRSFARLVARLVPRSESF